MSRTQRTCNTPTNQHTAHTLGQPKQSDGDAVLPRSIAVDQINRHFSSKLNPQKNGRRTTEQASQHRKKKNSTGLRHVIYTKKQEVQRSRQETDSNIEARQCIRCFALIISTQQMVFIKFRTFVLHPNSCQEFIQVLKRCRLPIHTWSYSTL